MRDWPNDLFYFDSVKHVGLAVTWLPFGQQGCRSALWTGGQPGSRAKGGQPDSDLRWPQVLNTEPQRTKEAVVGELLKGSWVRYLRHRSPELVQQTSMEGCLSLSAYPSHLDASVPSLHPSPYIHHYEHQLSPSFFHGTCLLLILSICKNAGTKLLENDM